MHTYLKIDILLYLSDAMIDYSKRYLKNFPRRLIEKGFDIMQQRKNDYLLFSVLLKRVSK